VPGSAHEKVACRYGGEVVTFTANVYNSTPKTPDRSHLLENAVEDDIFDLNRIPLISHMRLVRTRCGTSCGARGADVFGAAVAERADAV